MGRLKQTARPQTKSTTVTKTVPLESKEKSKAVNKTKPIAKPRKKPEAGVLEKETGILANDVIQLMKLYKIMGKVSTDPNSVPVSKHHDYHLEVEYKKLNEVKKSFTTEMLSTLIKKQPELVFVQVERTSAGKYKATTRFVQ